MRVIISILIAAIPFISKAQDTSKIRQTKYEEFSSEDGILKKMESHKFGKVKGFVLYKKTTTDVESGKFFNAVEVSEKFNLWTGKGGSSIVFDEDEIPSIIKTLKYFLGNVMQDVCKEECPNYLYETVGGAYIYCNKNIGAYGSSWHVYVGRSPFSITYNSIDLDNKDLDNFIKLLESYK